jgi:4-hydroxyphenylpyruvate dioxygenase-like putative hemolysin
MVQWYTEILGQRILLDRRSDGTGLVYLIDPTFEQRRCVNVLATPDNDAEAELVDRHGPCISTALYQAVDVAGAYADAVSSGFQEVSAPSLDSRTKVLSCTLREPSGNLVQIREPLTV